MKNPIFKRGVHEKPTYRENCLKRGPWAVRRFMWGLREKRGMVFLRGG